LDCRIEDDQITKKYFVKTPWKLTNSLEANINEVIVDQRWEGKSMSNINMYVITKITFKMDTTNIF
jgi:hypothetical protein